MSQPKKKRALIVGQGIAGTLLAWELKRKHWDIAVVDEGAGKSSSRAAPGVVNPIDLRKPGPAWGSSAFLPVALRSYEAMERDLGPGIYLPMNLAKVFRNGKEKEKWSSEKAQRRIAPYVKNEGIPEALVHSAYGYQVMGPAATIDVRTMIDRFRDRLRAEGRLYREQFRPKDLVISDRVPVQWKGEPFDRVIFCEGFKGRENPWFQHVPITPVKGESFVLKGDGDQTGSVIHREKFLAPMPGPYFRFGSTYDHSGLDLRTTQKGGEELREGLHRTLNGSFEVVEQCAGIRPGSTDARPHLGEHPHYPALCILNGLGSKGLTIGPYLALRLSSLLERGEVISEEVNVKRWSESYP